LFEYQRWGEYPDTGVGTRIPGLQEVSLVFVEALDEPALVWTSKTGVPRKLEWRNRRFVVSTKPVPWVNRVPWWQLTNRAPSNGADVLAEQQMWQVQVLAVDNGQVFTLDLLTANGEWRVTRVSE
jgi:hypothetical protein